MKRFYIESERHFERISSVVPANTRITNKYLMSGVRDTNMQTCMCTHTLTPVYLLDQ